MSKNLFLILILKDEKSQCKHNLKQVSDLVHTFKIVLDSCNASIIECKSDWTFGTKEQGENNSDKPTSVSNHAIIDLNKKSNQRLYDTRLSRRSQHFFSKKPGLSALSHRKHSTSLKQRYIIT